MWQRNHLSRIISQYNSSFDLLKVSSRSMLQHVIDSYLECLCLRSTEYQLLKSGEFVWQNITLQNFLKSIDSAISILTTKSKLELNSEKHILLPVYSGNNHWILCIDNLKIGVVEVYDSIVKKHSNRLSSKKRNTFWTKEKIVFVGVSTTKALASINWGRENSHLLQSMWVVRARRCRVPNTKSIAPTRVRHNSRWNERYYREEYYATPYDRGENGEGVSPPLMSQ